MRDAGTLRAGATYASDRKQSVLYNSSGPASVQNCGRWSQPRISPSVTADVANLVPFAE